MELTDYLRILRAHWLGIIVFILAGVIGAYGWSLLQTKVYAADSSAIVTVNGTGSVGDSLVGDNLAKSRVTSYMTIASSRAVAEYAIDHLHLTTSPEALVGKISASNPDNTAVIDVTAHGSTPESARELAETWIRGVAEQVNQLEKTSVVPSQNGDGTSSTSGPAVSLKTLDSAVLPTSPIFPDTKLALALGALIGLAVGIAYAILRRVLDRRVRGAQQVEQAFDLPVIGTIPQARSVDGGKRVTVSGFDARSGDASKSDRQLAEAMRELRTNLQFMDVDNPPRLIVVTSPLPGDGKSTVTANLAATIAAGGQRVILVDGDLRRPTVAESFGLRGSVGLTDVLIGRAEIRDVVQPWHRNPRLSIIATGSIPPNPSELLGSHAMMSLMRDLSKHAIVLIDASPLIPVTDAAVLAARTDGALIVARSGKTTIDALDKALQNLEKVKARPLGIIVNGVKRGRGDSYSGEYVYRGTYSSSDKTAVEFEPALDRRGAESSALTFDDLFSSDTNGENRGAR